MPRFVFNDETQINSYGFSIPNKGIDTARFKQNPVMLDQHYNSTSHVIGKWVDLKVEGAQFSGDSEFDLEDDDAKKIAGKVDRGYIKGASMGVTFNHEHMKQQPDGSWQLTKCQLYEVSIVAVPSNASSLTLFAETGELLSEEDVKLSISQLQAEVTTNPEEKNKEQMEKFNLSAAALTAVGLENADDANAVSTKILSLHKSLEDEKAAHQLSKNKLAEQADAQAVALVDAAVLSGKITEAEREETLADAKLNYTLTAKLLNRIPEKKTLGNTVDNSTDAATMTLDTFQALDSTAQLKFKNENPGAYAAMFKK